ncbi:hypothetical protein [Dysgonomonas sp.]
MKTRTILLIFFSVLLLPSCTVFIKSNKAEGYNNKIKDDITVFVLVASVGPQSKWSNALKTSLESEFAKMNVLADISVHETGTYASFLKEEDIKTNHENGLILIIAEAKRTMSDDNKYVRGDFTITLTDNNLGKNVWRSQIPVIFKGGLGSAESRGNSTAGYIIKKLKSDKLL